MFSCILRKERGYGEGQDTTRTLATGAVLGSLTGKDGCGLGSVPSRLFTTACLLCRSCLSHHAGETGGGGGIQCDQQDNVFQDCL